MRGATVPAGNSALVHFAQVFNARRQRKGQFLHGVAAGFVPGAAMHANRLQERRAGRCPTRSTRPFPDRRQSSDCGRLPSWERTPSGSISMHPRRLAGAFLRLPGQRNQQRGKRHGRRSASGQKARCCRGRCRPARGRGRPAWRWKARRQPTSSGWPNPGRGRCGWPCPGPCSSALRPRSRELRAAWLNSVGLEQVDLLRNGPRLAAITAGLGRRARRARTPETSSHGAGSPRLRAGKWV